MVPGLRAGAAQEQQPPRPPMQLATTTTKPHPPSFFAGRPTTTTTKVPTAAAAAASTSTAPPVACHDCAQLFTTPVNSSNGPDSTPWSLLCTRFSPGLVYSRRRSGLEASAAAGCALCELLLETVLEGERRRSNLRGYAWNLKPSKFKGEGGKDVELHFEFTFETDPSADSTSMAGPAAVGANWTTGLAPVLRVSRLGTLFTGTLQFDVATEHGDPLAKPQPHVGGLPEGKGLSLPVCSINSDRGTLEELGLVKSWVDWCDNGHRSCVRKRRALPSRVLDVSVDSNFVYLVGSANLEPEPYATLSYCWGKSQTVVTTEKTLGAHMLGLEVPCLPRTLQDGIKTTRALGLKYLWVDSLCIVQDNVEDKEHEMARMQQVFQNSHVTIVAARARSCHEGFLKAERSRDPLVKLPVLCPNGELGSMHLLPRKQPLAEQPTREPLHERGWTLQEIVLSPRLLIYGRELVVWRCTAGEKVRDCSTGRHNPLDWNGYCAAAGLTTIRLSPKGRIHQPRLSTHSPHSMFTQSERLPRLFRTWKFVVHDYTTRHLSNPMDKLPALSGIVTYFRDAMEDTYLAGLWEKHLLHELSWIPTGAVPSSRPPAYRAPSWSWMSIDGAIAFQADACSWYEPVAEVLSCSVTPALPHAPLSRLVAGSLSLNGYMRPNVPTLLSPRTPFNVVAGPPPPGCLAAHYASDDDTQSTKSGCTTALVPIPNDSTGAFGTIYLDVPTAAERFFSEEGGSEGALKTKGEGRGTPRSRTSQGVYWCFMLARCFTRTPAEDDVMVDIETVWGLALALSGDEFERVGYFVGGGEGCRSWFEGGGRRDVTIV